MGGLLVSGGNAYLSRCDPVKHTDLLASDAGFRKTAVQKAGRMLYLLENMIQSLVSHGPPYYLGKFSEYSSVSPPHYKEGNDKRCSNPVLPILAAVQVLFQASLIFTSLLLFFKFFI